MNSRRNAVFHPVFGWLEAYSAQEPEWPAQLVALAHGLETAVKPGRVIDVVFEHPVQASAERLQWLVDQASELGHEGEKLSEIVRRAGSGEARLSVLEGTTYADCLIECEGAIIWAEGKWTHWLSPGTTWYPHRDQLARNLEAAWLMEIERQQGCDCVLLCHESDLSDSEQLLVNGYRSGELVGGLPHLDDTVRADFRARIGTVTWREIIDTWPALRADPLLADC